MRKPKKIQSIRAQPGAQPNAPARLAEEWQAAGREWAHWWLRAASGAPIGMLKAMAEPKPDFFVSTDEPVEVDAATLAAIDRGILDADQGRTVSIDVLGN